MTARVISHTMLITWTVEFRLYEGKLQKEDKTLQINHVFFSMQSSLNAVEKMSSNSQQFEI
jgi:hypothetical protein